ncbi:hypothetical protein HOG16_02105 [Candidatus Woesearchaeota archaeon]|jgi:5'-nucleotidase|nr:hypothetical protein [Candidatus Woesearchaeota archaeon]MBT4321637.1 hypothetical protein [Candidatus Woesearchaeota archaeon]MBT4631052.1 hypothetical protein [Candidatus Woesearchaeota archaeon]
MKLENIALFDMDGTLCDYDAGLFEKLEELRSSDEPTFHPPIRSNAPEYIKKRSDLIRRSEDWWENLPRFQLGWDILEVAKELGYRTMILTQGPRKNPYAWSGKKKWIDRNLGEDQDVTMTRDKGLIYGKILVDDFTGYVERWLGWRKRGLVIMPASKENEGYSHEQVIRYNGENLEEVREAMEKAKLREE